MSHDTPSSSNAPGQAAGGLRLQARRLTKRYGARDVLRDAQIDIAPGEFVAIVGRSGCGKSTLLRLVAGLEAPSSGALEVDGHPVAGLHGDTRIMFQEARLLPWRRVLGNVTLGLPATEQERGREVLAQVGLADRAGEWPARLSGGQRQRVALARALVTQPACVLADEPTGNLDHVTAQGIFDLMLELSRTLGTSFVIVTHDPELARRCDRALRLTEHGLQPEAA